MRFIKRHSGSTPPPDEERRGRISRPTSADVTPVLSPGQIRSLRADLGLSRIQLGRALGFHSIEPDRAVASWEHGRSTIPGPCQLILLARWRNFREEGSDALLALRIPDGPPPPR